MLWFKHLLWVRSANVPLKEVLVMLFIEFSPPPTIAGCADPLNFQPLSDAESPFSTKSTVIRLAFCLDSHRFASMPIHNRCQSRPRFFCHGKCAFVLKLFVRLTGELVRPERSEIDFQLNCSLSFRTAKFAAPKRFADRLSEQLFGFRINHLADILSKDRY